MATNDSGSQRLLIRKNTYLSAIGLQMRDSYSSGKFSDVALTSQEGINVKCHRIVLSSCSPYFKKLFYDLEDSPIPCHGSVVLFLKDVKHWELCALMDYIYKGEMVVDRERLPKVLAAAASLQIESLQRDVNINIEWKSEVDISIAGSMSAPASNGLPINNENNTDQLGIEMHPTGSKSAVVKPKMAKYSDVVKATNPNSDTVGNDDTKIYELLSLSSSSLSSLSSGPSPNDRSARVALDSVDNRGDSLASRTAEQITKLVNEQGMIARAGLQALSDSYYPFGLGSVSNDRATAGSGLERVSTKTKTAKKNLITGKRPILAKAAPAMASGKVLGSTNLEMAGREELMKRAVEAYQSGGAGISQVAAMFRIPRSTLQNRVKQHERKRLQALKTQTILESAMNQPPINLTYKIDKSAHTQQPNTN